MICPNCNKNELSRMGELHVCQDCPPLIQNDQGAFRPATQAEIETATKMGQSPQGAPIDQSQTETQPQPAQPEQVPPGVPDQVQASPTDSINPNEGPPDRHMDKPGPELIESSGLDDTLEIDIQFT